MKAIFIVDDSESGRVAAKSALDGHYMAYALPSAAAMFRLLDKIVPELILLDIEMPEMGGFEALTMLKASQRTKNIPVIFLTGKSDTQTEIRGFDAGAVDFIHKPFSSPVLMKRIETHINIDEIVKNSLKVVKQAYQATISGIADIVESRDHGTGGHIARTREYLMILVQGMIDMGLYTDEVHTWNLDILASSAQLHDVGKVKVSDLILNKPGKLSVDEFAQVMLHCADGEQIIDKIITSSEDERYLIHAKRFAASHHERWDGSGYPLGLKGEAIPLEGRIMAIADVYDALVSERPYKKPFTHEEAMEIIRDDAGKHFDPKLVELFLTVAHEFALVFPEGGSA